MKLIMLCVFVSIGLFSCENKPKSDDEYTIEKIGRDLLIKRTDGAFSVIINSNTSKSYLAYEVDGVPYIQMEHAVGVSEIDHVDILESSSSKKHVFRTLDSTGKIVGSYEVEAP